MTFDLSDAMPKEIATAMNACGRTSTSTFKDLRSPSVANKRTQKRNRKYYNFGIIKLGQLGRDHYYEGANPWPSWQSWPADKSQYPIVKMNKKQMFEEAKATAPFLPYYCSCCHRESSMQKDAERKEAAAHEEAYDWKKFGFHTDFVTSEDWIEHDYMAGYDAKDDYWAWASALDEGGLVKTFAFDLAPLLDAAMAKRGEKERIEIEAEGWADVSMDSVTSPEMHWVIESDELLKAVESFEMI
jgi:hypothetical protein